ncbi:hypothetical protein COL922a_006805 [Colletotrichum nupharicola]|nr:hypothetical protein COL922a_006805 [Colletotrichum nupharicola]
MFLLRLLFRVYETPKYLLGRGLDREAVEVVQKIATRNGGSTWLTLEHFEAIDADLGVTRDATVIREPRVDTSSILRRQLESFKPEKIFTLFSTPRE